MDTVDITRFIFAFLFVMGLIALLGYGLKRYGGAHKLAGGRRIFSMHDEGGRIQVVEVRYLDPRRRLMLIRRDNVEHLLLIADSRELVIESGIEMSMMNSSTTKEDHG
jgi:flagellar protein FliO/FliZ